MVPEAWLYTGEVLDIRHQGLMTARLGQQPISGRHLTVERQRGRLGTTDLGRGSQRQGIYPVFQEGDKTISKTFTVAQSGAGLTGDGAVETYKGDTPDQRFHRQRHHHRQGHAHRNRGGSDKSGGTSAGS